MALTAAWRVVYTGRWDPHVKALGWRWQEMLREWQWALKGENGWEEWDKNNPWDGGLFGQRRGQIWGGPQLFALDSM